MTILKSLAIAFAFLVLFRIGPAFAFSVDQINQAVFEAARRPPNNTADPFLVKAQVLLGRRGISPGVVDGIDGENFHKAIAQFRRQENLGEGDQIDQAAWAALGGDGTTDIIVDYTVTKEDAGYDYADEIPHDYAKQAKMKRLAYTSAEERFGERFHMSEALLKMLNPGKDFAQDGAKLAVASIPRAPERDAVLHVDAVKRTGMVVVFGADEKILASYPATIGSDATPSPSGDYKIQKVVRNPNYTYDPEKNFQQGNNDEVLTLPPGPNNPVGSVWIGLSKPSFGIHGSPEPSKVSKTASHGCVRLTNWDAEDLASMVKPGVVVRFVE